jgi:hypothetical protein
MREQFDDSVSYLGGWETSFLHGRYAWDSERVSFSSTIGIFQRLT